MVQTGSHQKQLAEKVQFRAPVAPDTDQLDKLSSPDDVEIVHAQDVHNPIVETDATHIVAEVADEVVNDVVHPDDVVADEVVQSDVIVVDPIPSATVDTDVTTPSIEPSVQTNEGFLGGPIDRSTMAGRGIYIICLSVIYLLLFYES